MVEKVEVDDLLLVPQAFDGTSWPLPLDLTIAVSGT